MSNKTFAKLGLELVIPSAHPERGHDVWREKDRYYFYRFDLGRIPMRATSLEGARTEAALIARRRR